MDTLLSEEAASPPGKHCALPISLMGDSTRADSNRRKGSRFASRPLNQPRGFEPGTSRFRGGRFAHCATWTPWDSHNISLVEMFDHNLQQGKRKGSRGQGWTKVRVNGVLSRSALPRHSAGCRYMACGAPPHVEDLSGEPLAMPVSRAPRSWSFGGGGGGGRSDSCEARAEGAEAHHTQGSRGRPRPAGKPGKESASPTPFPG